MGGVLASAQVDDACWQQLSLSGRCLSITLIDIPFIHFGQYLSDIHRHHPGAGDTHYNDRHCTSGSNNSPGMDIF
jgi:hypothetical protein